MVVAVPRSGEVHVVLAVAPCLADKYGSIGRSRKAGRLIEAIVWGGLAASSLLVGSAIAFFRPVGRRALGLIMAFGSGVLISAVAYDLVADAFASAGGNAIWLGLFVGAVTFFVGDLLIDRAGGEDRKSADPVPGRTPSSAKPIFLGTVLDGVPESVVLGLILLSGEGLSVAFFVAVFLSNLPESISSTTGFLKDGMSPRRIVAMWGLVVLVSALAAGLGFAFFDSASPSTIAFVQAFAAGAILTMLADSMVPEAFRYARNVAGLATTLGFAVAFAIATLEKAG
jgi:ZIP family zinc transporter